VRRAGIGSAGVLAVCTVPRSNIGTAAGVDCLAHEHSTECTTAHAHAGTPRKRAGKRLAREHSTQQARQQQSA
jgi:hypothetical protein